MSNTPLLHVLEHHDRRRRLMVLQVDLFNAHGDMPTTLIYRDRPDDVSSKDYQFSRTTMDEHWQAGVDDMTETFAHPELLRRRSHAVGVTTYDMLDRDGFRIHQATDFA